MQPRVQSILSVTPKSTLVHAYIIAQVNLSLHSALHVSLPVWRSEKVRQYVLSGKLRVTGHPITSSGLQSMQLNPLRSHQLSKAKLPWGSTDAMDPLVVIRRKLQYTTVFDQYWSYSYVWKVFFHSYFLYTFRVVKEKLAKCSGALRILCKMLVF